MHFVLLTTLVKYNDESRMQEIMHAIQKNCDNRWIDKVVLFFEKYENSYSDLYQVLKNDKITIISVDERMTYNRVFEYCNKNFKGVRCIVSNSDIFFDHNIEYAYCLDYQNLFVCLTRYDKCDGNYKIKNDQGSFDSYLFIPPIKSLNKVIYFGINGCDSYLVQKMNELNYHIINPCLNLPSYHNHNIGVGGNSLQGWTYWQASDYKPIKIKMSKL